MTGPMAIVQNGLARRWVNPVANDLDMTGFSAFLRSGATEDVAHKLTVQGTVANLRISLIPKEHTFRFRNCGSGGRGGRGEVAKATDGTLRLKKTDTTLDESVGIESGSGIANLG